jgi:hypothetical protein
VLERSGTSAVEMRIVSEVESGLASGTAATYQWVTP